MSNSLDSALAFCLASYSPSGDAAPKVVATVKVVKNPIKTHIVVESGEVAAPANKLPPPVSMVLPPSGTLDAKSFLVAMRRAKSRDESIAAIAAYIGYDGKVPFGTQDSRARDQAKREINPPKAEAFKRSVIPSVMGYVAGAPDHSERAHQNLLARERHAVNMMLDHDKASNEAKTDQERTLYAGLALVERERLIQIRKDLTGY